MGALIGIVRRRAMRKGVMGGDRVWMSVWALIVGAQLFRRLFGEKPVIERFELRPGESIVVTDLGRPDQP